MMLAFLRHQNQNDLNNFAFSHEAETLELYFCVYWTSVTARFHTFIVSGIQNQYKQHQFLLEAIIFSNLVCL